MQRRLCYNSTFSKFTQRLFSKIMVIVNPIRLIVCTQNKTKKTYILLTNMRCVIFLFSGINSVPKPWYSFIQAIWIQQNNVSKCYLEISIHNKVIKLNFEHLFVPYKKNIYIYCQTLASFQITACSDFQAPSVLTSVDFTSIYIFQKTLKHI